MSVKSRRFTITYEATSESEWPDGSGGLLDAVETAERDGDTSEVEMMVWQAAQAGRLRAIEVKAI